MGDTPDFVTPDSWSRDVDAKLRDAVMRGSVLSVVVAITFGAPSSGDTVDCVVARLLLSRCTAVRG